MKPSEEHARYGVSRAKDVGGGGVVQVVLVPEGKQIWHLHVCQFSGGVNS